MSHRSHRSRVLAASSALLLASSLAGAADEWPAPRTMVVETAPLRIDKLYPSMTGPHERMAVDWTQLDWVTALRSDVIDDASGEALGGEFLCHSQLQMREGARFAVTATGATEMRLPQGFGMPLNRVFRKLDPAQRTLDFFGMALNNHYPVIDKTARVRATIEYLKDEDIPPSGITPLLYFDLTMSVDDIAEYEPAADAEIDDDVTTHCALVEGHNTHWVVPPGPQLTRKRFKGRVPMDVTIHYILVHMHNHGVFTRLTDTTTGEVLFQADVEYDDRRQITHIPSYSSVEGFPMYQDREYEMEAFYENTADHDVDAMAVMYMYFSKPESKTTAGSPELRPGG